MTILIFRCFGCGRLLQLVPVDVESGEIIGGVCSCRVEQGNYGDLPKLIIELIDFEVDVVCGSSHLSKVPPNG